MILALAAAAGGAGCSQKPATPAAAPSTAPPAAASPIATPIASPVQRLKAPAVIPGELVRVVLSQKGGRVDQKDTVTRPARAHQEYWVHAACTASTPGTTLSYEVRSGKVGASDSALAGGDLPCDGQLTVNGVGPLPAEAVVVYLRGVQADVTSAYAVLAPSD